MEFKRFLAYSASAGSGKTYALSIRYIALLFLGQNPSSILAATFTKKAANEMKQRVLKFLKSLPFDSQLVENLSKASGLSSQEILSKQPVVLEKFIKSQNYIVTLDSFFNSILRSCSLEIGLDANFAIKDNAHEELQEHFLKELKSSSQLTTLSKLSLNLQKRKASEVMDLLALLYQLDAILPDSSYSAYNLKELEGKIDSLRLEILEKIKALGVSKSAINIFAKEEFKDFITQGVFEKESLSEHRFFAKYLKQDESLDGSFLALKELIANYHIKLEQTLLYYIFELYNGYKSSRLTQIGANGELDFNDILYYTYRLISSEITKDFIYFKLDSKFKHILLDEFQDTSSLQFLILEPLIEEIFAGRGSSDFRSFFYVGDTKQSLYRFRGGVEELFEYLANRYNIEIENLDTNYRSAKNIVEFTNRCFRDTIGGYVDQKAHSKIEGYVEVIKSEDLLQKCKERVEFYLQHGAKLEDIAILVFANKDGVVVQEYLDRYNIASILKTSSSLKFNPKIAALVGVLEYMITNQRLSIEPFLNHLGLDTINLEHLNFKSSPFELLDYLVREYRYFDNDLNILKLLDFAKNYATIEEFLYEFGRSNITLSKSSQRGLQIMTIHGSKGLEFKYTIVLDRLGGRAPTKDMLMFNYKSPVKIDKIYYKHSKKENFLPNYKEALIWQKELALKDRLNLLYVAITRAELALSVITKDRASEFDIIKLDDQKIGSIEIEQQESKREPKKLDIKLLKYGAQEVTQTQEDDQDEILNYENIYFGEAMHMCLELANLQTKEYKSAIESINNKFGYILSKDAIKDIENRVKNLLNDTLFNSLCKDATILKEQPIIYNGNFYQIDLLLKSKKLNIVLDYKSSKSFSNKHIEQVSIYKQALKAIEQKETKAYIVYLLKSGVEFVEV
jgi:exodeoxyribonuclease V beta subunit